MRNAGDDFAHPHDILVADEHLLPSSPLVLVCVKTLYLCVSKHQLCFHLIPASLETASVIMVLLLRTICRQAPVIEQICYDMTRTEFLHILN